MATVGFQLDTKNIQPYEILIYLPLYHETQGYLKQLAAIPLESSLGEDGQAKCKMVGQNIFNRYKKFAGGSSLIGMMAMSRIYNAFDTNEMENICLRKHFVNQAWNGVGDANYQWENQASAWAQDNL